MIKFFFLNKLWFPFKQNQQKENKSGRCSKDTQDNALRGREEEELQCTRKTWDKNKDQIQCYCCRELRDKNRMIENCRVSFIVAISK